MTRTSYVQRSTRETQIEVSLNLDGSGIQDIKTPIPFLDHMLSQLAKHGYFDLKVKAQGDTQIDFHHTVEDVGIAVGQAFKEALGGKKVFADLRRLVFLSMKPLPNASLISVVELILFLMLNCLKQN